MKLIDLKFKLIKIYNQADTYLWLTVFIILGLALRLHHIALRTYWLDEANSVNLVFSNFGQLYGEIIVTGNSLAYIYFIKIWSYLFGNSELSIRLLSTLAALIAVIAIYKLGRLMFNKTVGLWAAFLLAINYFSVFYSIQARPYSLEILFSIITYYYFVQILKSTKLTNLIFYIFATVIGIYFHPWFFLLFASQFFYLLVSRNKNIKIYFAQLVVITMCLPWAFILIKLAKLGFSEFIAGVDPAAIMQTFNYFTYGNKILILIFSSVAFLVAIFQKKDNQGTLEISLNENVFNNVNKKIYLVLNYLLFPILSAFIIAQFIPFYETGRYEAVVLPAFILILASLWSNIKNKTLIAIVSLCLIYGSFVNAQDEKNSILSYKFNDRTITKEVLKATADGDWLVFTGLSRPTFDYYLRKIDQENKIINKFSFPAEMAVHPAYLNEARLLNNFDIINREADELLKNFNASGAKKMLVVYSGGATSQLLTDKLNKTLKNTSIIDATDKSVSGENKGSNFHFQSILIYEK